MAPPMWQESASMKWKSWDGLLNLTLIAPSITLGSLSQLSSLKDFMKKITTVTIVTGKEGEFGLWPDLWISDNSLSKILPGY